MKGKGLRGGIVEVVENKGASLRGWVQITVPRDIQRRLGVRAGDKLEFEGNGNGVQVKAVRNESVFEKYRGIGTPGIGSGRKAISKSAASTSSAAPTAG